MKKALFIIISILAIWFAFFSCQKMFDNPYDAIFLNKDAWAPDSLNYSILSKNKVKLTWTQNESRIDGFVIDKFYKNQWINNYAFVTKDKNYWIDTYSDHEPPTIAKYRIYATAGNNKSAIKELETFIGLIDTRDNNYYKIEKIDNQIWMAENLKYLPSVNSVAYGSETIPHFYVYGYDGTDVEEAKATENYATYGVLYNWSAAMAGATSSNSNPSGVQGICPEGWHLPSDTEWKQLTDYLGENAGGKLKEAGTTHWNAPNTEATNESGFTALPGGGRAPDGHFDDIGYYGFWWSATEYLTNDAWARNLFYFSSNVYRNHGDKGVGFSVRCVRD